MATITANDFGCRRVGNQHLHDLDSSEPKIPLDFFLQNNNWKLETIGFLLRFDGC